MPLCNQRLFVPCLPDAAAADPCVLSPVGGIPFSGPCAPPDGATFAVTARIVAALPTGTRWQDRTVDVSNAGGVLSLANDVVVRDGSTGDGAARLALGWDVGDGTLRASVTVTPPNPPLDAMESLSAAAEMEWVIP